MDIMFSEAWGLIFLCGIPVVATCMFPSSNDDEFYGPLIMWIGQFFVFSHIGIVVMFRFPEYIETWMSLGVLVEIAILCISAVIIVKKLRRDKTKA